MTKTIETAAPLPASSYRWQIYTAERGTRFTTTNGKRSLSLKKGSKFGIRRASADGKYRMISEEHGPTIVFSLTEDQAYKLIMDKSKSLKNLQVLRMILLPKHRLPRNQKTTMLATMT